MMAKRARRLAYLLFSLLLPATAVLGLPGTAAADTPVPLYSLAPGTTVNFVGHTWIVVNPSTGYLWMKDVYSYQPFDSEFDQNWLSDAMFNPSNPRRDEAAAMIARMLGLGT